MKRSAKRYAVYPAPKAAEVVGMSLPSLNLAIECWAAVLARAMADNAERFSPSYSAWDFNTLHEHCLHDWALLATVLRSMQFDPDFANPGLLLATAVEDAHRLEKAGREWFESERDIEWKEVDTAVARLVEKLRAKECDYTHAWAVIVAVRWLWDHQEQGIDIKKDPWWTLAFRRNWGKKNQNMPGEAAAARKSKKKAQKAPPSDRTKS
jgi:hypothetical protein